MGKIRYRYVIIRKVYITKYVKIKEIVVGIEVVIIIKKWKKYTEKWN